MLEAVGVTDGVSVVITTVGNEAVTSGEMRENMSIMVIERVDWVGLVRL